MDNKQNNNDFFSMFNTEVNKPKVTDESKKENTIQNDNENSTEVANNSEISSQVKVVNNNQIFDSPSFEQKQTEIIENRVSDNNKEEKYQKDVDINKVLFGNGSEDELLLSSYIGPNYEKIRSGSFNFAAAFLTNFYFFYRKMYLIGFIIVILNTIILILFNLGFIVSIILFFVVGVFTNQIYMIHVKGKIRKIKADNPNLSREELANLCSKEGGTSLGSVMLGILTVFVVSLVFELLGFQTVIDSFENLSTDNREDTVNPETNADTFIIPNDKDERLQNFDILDEMNIVLDTTNLIENSYIIDYRTNNFYRNSDSEYFYDFIHDSSNDDTDYMCRAIFTKVRNYNSIEDIVAKLSNDYEVLGVGSVLNINNILFEYFCVYNDDDTYLFFAHEDNNEVYLYSIISYGGFNDDDCLKYNLDVLSTLENVN